MIKSLCVAFVVLAQSGAVTKALKNVPRNFQSSGSQAELRGAPSLLLALAFLQHCSLRIHAHSVGSYSRCMSIEWSSSVRAAKLLLRYGSSWRASLLLDRRRARWRWRLEPCHACRRRTKESVQLRAASDRHACRLQQCSTRMQPCLPCCALPPTSSRSNSFTNAPGMPKGTMPCIPGIIIMPCIMSIPGIAMPAPAAQQGGH